MAGTTNYNPPSTVCANASLADDLNSFYARFVASNNTASSPANNNIVSAAGMSFTAGDEHTLSVTKHNLRRALMCVKTRKAAGADGISG